MSPWGWTPERQLGIWRHGATWLRPFLAAAPIMTVAVLLVMLYFISGTLTAAEGFVIDLPKADTRSGENAELVALIVPHGEETHVYFDDTRYTLEEALSRNRLAERIKIDAARHHGQATMLALADKTVAAGALVQLAVLVREQGVKHLILATKREQETE